MSIITMGFGLGLALGPLIAGFLAIYFFELPFLIGGTMLVIGAVIVYAYVPETISRKTILRQKSNVALELSDNKE